MAKFFGSGPVGLLVSLILFFVTYRINKLVDFPKISNDQFLLSSIFYISCALAALLIIWSIRSLPIADRGNKLCTVGVFKYIRHPLYAAFLSIFNFGLAFYLNSYIYILWAVLLHPIWHFIVKDEENLMINIFKDEYIQYQRKTGRFLPKF